MRRGAPGPRRSSGARASTPSLRVLGYLLVQSGFYTCGHRASADVDALIQILRTRDAGGRTALAEMIDRSYRPSWIVRAHGAHFDLKDSLKARGYRWDAERRVWWREVQDEDREPEEWWLAGNVYTGAANPRALGPELARISGRERFL